MKFSILLLEDDRELLRVLQQVLLDEEFDVDAFVSGEEAVQSARDRDYDLMIADIRMVGLDGLAALSQVQSYRPGLEAIVISGYADPEQARRASHLGIRAILKKPFSLDEFLDTVTRTLGERASRLKASHAFKGMQTTLAWSTRQLAVLLDGSNESRYSFQEVAFTTGFLCSQMSLLGALTERIRLAAVMAAWRESKKSVKFPFPDEVPAEVEAWLEALGEWWTGRGPQGLAGFNIPLASRIIVVSLAYVTTNQSPEQLEERWPGRFDPRLLEQLQHIEEVPAVVRPDLEGEADALLALTRAFIQRGEFERAESLLESIIKRGADSFSGIRALLLKAKLMERNEQPEQARLLALRAPEVSRPSGPLLYACTLFEAGQVLLSLMDRDEATHLFEQSAANFASLGLSAQASQARLMKSITEGTAFELETTRDDLTVLTHPSHRELLREIAAHLFSLSIQKPVSTDWGRQSLRRLARSFPAELGKVRESFSEQAWARVAELYTEENGRGSVPQEDPRKFDIEVNCLGGLQVIREGKTLGNRAWRTTKTRFLFARLLEAHPMLVSEEALIEEFWPGPLEKGRDSLYNATSQVRSVLRKAGISEAVIKTPTGVQLHPELKILYDTNELRNCLLQFEQSLKEGHWDQALPLARQAVLRAERPFLPDCYLDWAIRVRDQIEARVLSTCLAIAKGCYLKSSYPESIEFAKRGVEFDPLQEHLVAVLVESLIQSGRPAEAIRQYQSYVDHWNKEFGTDDAQSLEQMRTLAQSIVDGQS